MKEKIEKAGNVFKEVEEAEKIVNNVEENMDFPITKETGSYFTLLCC